VCHRTVSGAPGSSTPNLPPSEIWGGCSAIIHRTVRCSTGLSGVPAEQRLFAPTVVCKGTVKHYSACLCAQKSEQAPEGTTDSEQDLSGAPPDCQVAPLSEAPTIGTQRPGDVAGAPDCPVRHATEALTNGSFGGWGYKYPPTTTLQCIQVFSLETSYKSSRLHSKTQTKRSNPLPSPESLQTN
jgi:hypothetical protein